MAQLDETPEVSVKREATLEDCVTLLKATSDEQRFVGLLLVTRFLNAADEEAVQAVLRALDQRFLARLLKSVRLFIKKIDKGDTHATSTDKVTTLS